MKLWLCRDKGGSKEYRLFITPWFGVGSSHCLVAFCPKEFHRVTKFRLKPGGGPVEVKVTVERVNK